MRIRDFHFPIGMPWELFDVHDAVQEGKWKMLNGNATEWELTLFLAEFRTQMSSMQAF